MAIISRLPITHTPIQRLHETFVIAGLTNSYVAPHELKEVSYAQLLVVLETNDFPEEMICQVVFVDDIYDDLILKLGDEAREQTPIRSIPMLQFMVNTPIKANPDTYTELCSFLGFINQMLPFGFFLAEEKEGLFFRYIWTVDDQFVEQNLAVEIIEKITLFLNKFSQLICQVAEGKLTAQNAVANLSGEGN